MVYIKRVKAKTLNALNTVASDHEFLPSGLVVKVIPELKYKTESIGEVKVNTPYVQFNCVPQVNETMSYKVNW